MQIGIIGTGHMGGMLATAFAKTAPDTIYLYNRSRHKAEAIAAGFEQLVVCDDWKTLVSRVDAIFLCTKAADGLALAKSFGPMLRSDQLLVTTISSVEIDHWRTMTDATPIKLIPSLTQSVHSGVVLISYPRGTSLDVRACLESKVSCIGEPCVIDEAQVRICSDLTSCGPAFLATICKQWAEAAGLTGMVETAQAEHLISQMVIGFADLLASGMSIDEVVRRIRVPGGVTEIGIEAMSDVPLQLFHRLHEETARHAHQPPKKELSTRIGSTPS